MKLLRVLILLLHKAINAERSAEERAWVKVTSLTMNYEHMLEIAVDPERIEVAERFASALLELE